MEFEGFLKIDGVTGESQKDNHSGEIEVLSYTFGSTQSASAQVGQGQGVGKVKMQDLTITKYVDSASPLLFKANWTGQVFPTAVLSIRKAGGSQQDYNIVTLTSVVVSSAQNTGQSGGTGTLPTESISLNFAQIKFEYKTQKSDGTLAGSVQAGFNVTTMKAS